MHYIFSPSFHSFIHSGYFYGTSSSPLLLRVAPDYSIDTVSELTCRSATDNCLASSSEVIIRMHGSVDKVSATMDDHDTLLYYSVLLLDNVIHDSITAYFCMIPTVQQCIIKY